MIRTYKHSSKYTNSIKINKIISLGKEYKSYYNYTIGKLFKEFYITSNISKNPKRYDVSTLSQRYKSVCELQAIGSFKSYISNMKNYISETIIHSSVENDMKKILLYVNRSGKWFDNSFKIKGKDVPVEAFKILRSIFKHKKSNIFMKKLTMVLNADVVSVEKSNNSFDFWMKVSTLEKGHPVLIPIKSYDYFMLKDGIIKNSVQIIIKNNSIDFGLMKQLNKIENDFCSEIGIDVGLVNLITTSSGNMYGKKLYDQIKYYDKIIQHKMKYSQKQGLDTTEKIKKLYRKMKSLIKNEVGRCLNRIIEIEKPKYIVLENINSLSKKQNNNYSKTTRRLISGSAMKQIKRRLLDKAEIFDITVTEINPAYTSQQCSCCGHISSKNRKTQDKFVCQHCGKATHADYNASVNIRNRRSISEIDIYTKYTKVKDILFKIYPSTNTPITVGL